MKLTKFSALVAGSILLSACSQTADVAKAENAQIVPTKSERTVIYQCQNKTQVVATYSFTDNVATELTLTANNKVVKDLVRDNNNADFVSFKSNDYVWNVDTDFDLANYDKKTAVTLYKKGKKADKILAKNCKINEKETAKLNVNN